MIRNIRNCFFILICSFISISTGTAFAQANAEFENAKQLNKQQIVDLISNKAVTYRITVGGGTASATSIRMMKMTFTKTEEFGGTISAYSPSSSSDGKWHVTDSAKLVRQYDKVSWGNKPFAVAVYENNGKHYWKIGEEFQELVSIE